MSASVLNDESARLACDSVGSKMSVARFAGWNLLTLLPGAPLAEPRSTPGYMLQPASRAGIS